MSLLLKTNPKGIDVPIQAFQTFLYGQLKNKWNLTDANFNCHGRAYRNLTANGYTPEVFSGSDYSEVFYDDNLNALCFFSVGESQKYAKQGMTAPVSLIFMVNVKGIKPLVAHRADEEIRLDVETISTQKRNVFTYLGTDTGMDNVFKEYSSWKKSKSLKLADTHPKHCFRLNFNLLYNITN